MSHCTIYPQEHKLVVNTMRRASTQSDTGTFSPGTSSVARSSKRPSIIDTHRRSSLASSLSSLRLTRSKRTHSNKSNSTSQTATGGSNLGSLFFALPAEIQSLILSYLPLPTIFSLRLTSRTSLSLLHINAPSFTRSILASTIPAEHLSYIQTLYPAPTPFTSTNYLLQLLYRHHAIQNVIATIIAFIHMKIYMIRTVPRIENFAPYRDGLGGKIYPAAWTVYHYIESHRNIIVHAHATHARNSSASSSSQSQSQSRTRFWPCPQCQHLIASLANTYPTPRILPAYHFYGLLFSHLHASSRTPTYAGSIERKLRGWSRKPPTEEDFAIVVVLGGMRWMANSGFSLMKGSYSKRLEVLGGFCERVWAAVRENEGGSGVDEGIAGIKGKNGAVDGERDGEREREADPISEIATPFSSITPETIEALPHIDDFFISEFQRRILDEDLLGRVLGAAGGANAVGHGGGAGDNDSESEESHSNESGDSESDADSEGSSDDESQQQQQQQQIDADESELEMLRQRELQTPFLWVQRLMGEIDEEAVEAQNIGAQAGDGLAGAEGAGAM